MKRAVGLVRVSSELQKDRGYGIPAQIEGVLEHMEERGYELVEETGFATEGIDPIPGFFQEDFTGKTPVRPAIAALQEAIKPYKIDVVVIHRTSRLGRRSRVQDLLEEDLRARGVEVEYATAEFDVSTYQGRFVRRMMANVDELDYEQNNYQLWQGRRTAAINGSVILTRPPYGYRLVKEETESGRIIFKLEIVEEERQIVVMIYEWFVY